MMIKIDDTYRYRNQQYLVKLNEESNINFQILINLLSSYWKSTIEGPEYTKHLKALAIELARIRITLSNIFTDIEYKSTRTEFLYQTLTYLMMKNKSINTAMSDVEFRDFLVNLLKVYFKGSIPSSIKSAVELITNSEVVITEKFNDKNSDISSEFEFDVSIKINNVSEGIMSDFSVKTILDIIRPAHTIYRVMFILNDEYIGASEKDGCSYSDSVIDSLDYKLDAYSYEDFRMNNLGIKGVDELGRKVKKTVINEDHSSDF